MRFRTERKRNNSFLDITPVVDTVFNLLIFFALSLNFISTPGIQISLPKSSAKEVAKEERDLRVSIKPSGELYLGEVKVNLNQLNARFKQAVASSDEIQLLIQADENVSHGKVVEVMDSARQAGLYRMAIVTRLQDKSR